MEGVGAAALILGLGVAAQWLAWRIRIPSILTLLAAGFLAGPIFGWVDVDALLGDLLEPAVTIGVGLLVFEGGLGLRLRDLRGHGTAVVRLVTIGVLVTGIIAAVAAHVLFGLSWEFAILLGALLTVSGPTVVLPLLRQLRLKPDVAAVLRWEGILVDPIGALLAVLAFEFIIHGNPDQVWTEAGTSLITAMSAGVMAGILGALLLVILEARYRVPDHLTGPFGLALVVTTMVGADALVPEAGLVAATVMGVILANQHRVSIQALVDFKEDLGKILLGSLFVILAARVDLEDMVALGWKAPVFLAILVLVARPLAVWLSTVGGRLSWRERGMLAWMAPRGVVAAGVATFIALRLDAAGRPGGELLVPVVFLVVVATVLLYGITARPIAAALKVQAEAPRGILLVGSNVFSRELAKTLEEAEVPYLLVDASAPSTYAASSEGRKAVVDNALRPGFEDETDLSGLGTMWALTPTEDTNVLLCVRYASVFGRANVFRIATGAKPWKSTWGGRVLSASDYGTLRDRVQSGWRVSRTLLTDQFTMEEHRKVHPDGIPLLIIRSGAVRSFALDAKLKAEPGDAVVALVGAENSPVANRAEPGLATGENVEPTGDGARNEGSPSSDGGPTSP